MIGRQKLAPGESTELTATLHADASRGLKTTRIDIRHRVAGEVVESNLTLELSADVMPHYAVRPAVLTFDPQHRERMITLSPNFGPDVEVLSASCSHPAFKVEIAADSRSARRTIRVRFDPSRWSDGFLRPRVMLLTSSRYQAHCSLAVAAAPIDH